MPRLWVADDLPDHSNYDDYIERGDSYSVADGDVYTYPEVTRPIGFMRDKPRVRVKAWTMPIIKES